MSTPLKPIANLKRKRSNPLALKEALAQLLPSNAADFPTEVRLPWHRALYHGGSLLVEMLSLIAIVYFAGTAALNIILVLLLLAALGFVAIGLVMPALSAVHTVRVSEEGLRWEKYRGGALVPWWQVSRLEAKRDLSAIRVHADGRLLLCDWRPFREEERRELILAIRARLPEGKKIEEWGGRWFEGITQYGVPGLVRRAAGIALLLSLYLLELSLLHGSVGGSLGVRCSGPSSYLQHRFGLPEYQGCVILRVSGPAERAGLRQGDLMIAMNGAPITSGPQFDTRFFADAKRSRHFSFTVVRAGVPYPLDFDVTLGSRGPLPDQDDEDPLFYYLRARGNVELSPEEKVRYYSQAIGLAPDFDLAYLYRAHERLRSSSQPLSDLEAAESDIRRALQLDPQLPEAHDTLAMVLGFDQHEYAAALEHANTGIGLADCTPPLERWDYDCGRFLITRAQILIMRNQPGDLDLAEVDLTVAEDVLGLDQRRQEAVNGLFSARVWEAVRKGTCYQGETPVPCKWKEVTPAASP